MLIRSSREPFTYFSVREINVSRAFMISQGSYSYEMLSGTMFSASKLDVKSPGPLMSSIFSSPCSVMSTPFFARPSRWASQMELLPEVMQVRIYFERTWEERYNVLALMPRMTLIIRLERIRYSTYLLLSRLSPTAISVSGMPFRYRTNWVMAGSRMISRWLERQRNFLEPRCFKFSTPS